MAETTLTSLRDLRTRTEALLRRMSRDLRPFLHKDDGETFLRVPNSQSIPGDVNVTTTCSCVMALASTNLFSSFYHPKDANSVARSILKKLMDAPWMSSGLTSNNAFTTALVLRTYGLMVHFNLLQGQSLNLKKPWELKLRIQDAKSLATKLQQQNDEVTRFLFQSLSDKTRRILADAAHNGEFSPSWDASTFRDALTSDLRRIIHGTSIYCAGRFQSAKSETIAALESNPTTYKLAEINHRLLSEEFPDEISTPEPRTLEEIAAFMAEDVNYFKINDYPPSASVVYWFVDGVSRAKISLKTPTWRKLCEWASLEFSRLRSLVVAKHDAMMDPISMGMAACLCARLRAMSSEAHSAITEEERALLPSAIELVHSLKELFHHQAASGIWPKYFPMFHYQDAGSNFCFTFELLDAVLHEFGAPEIRLLDEDSILQGLDTAVTWCERNYLEFFEDGTPYSGWNSGGNLETLRKGQPESWATAVVYMYLEELTSVLSRNIQQRVLKKYKAHPARDKPDESLLDRMLDIELLMEDKSNSLRSVLKDIVVPANRGKDEQTLRRAPAKSPISALLFGPPGTSKSKVTEAVAIALQWPRVVINPSEFVKGTLANVYVQADEIFRDLLDLSAVVVFFDEMDALTQSRADGRLDTATQFLTTSMLPNLTELHDKRRVVFFMATNYQDKFDSAIKRAGRFDLLLCMGPPTLNEKIEKLNAFFPIENSDVSKTENAKKQLEKAKQKLSDLVSQLPLSQKEQLELLTFAEFGQFLKSVGNEDNIGDKLEVLSPSAFQEIIADKSQYALLKLSDLDLPEGKSYRDWIDSPKSKKKSGLEIVKYLRDRKASKSQFQ